MDVIGLCHDLGHGPFSHVFDGVFMKKMHPYGVLNSDGVRKEWKHEEGSVKMFRYILDQNDISYAEYDLDDNDITFIEEMILGVDENQRVGREKDKFYLYDIVNNTRSGLDVDKLDYLARDMRMANVQLQSNFER